MKDFDKFLWVMFWWAIGDSFWVPIEFFYPWDFEPVDVIREIGGFFYKNILKIPIINCVLYEKYDFFMTFRVVE